MKQPTDTIIDRHGASSEQLIPILQDIQEEMGYLPDSAVRRAAESLGMPPAKIYAVASCSRPRISGGTTPQTRRWAGRCSTGSTCGATRCLSAGGSLRTWRPRPSERVSAF